MDMHADARIARALLLAPPYGGSFAARSMARSAPGRVLLGRSIPDWLAAPSRPGMNAGTEVGVIAGDRRFGLGCLVAPSMPRPNDGVVTVEETRVPGMRDHIVLPVSHSAMLLSSKVAGQACEFLSRGAFARTPG
jgi:hypothetical protein